MHAEAPVNRYPVWLRFQTWFVGLTLLYFVLAMSGAAYYAGSFSDSGPGTPGHRGAIIGNVIGMFVPIGPSNLMFFFLPTGLIALALVVAALIFVERRLSNIDHDGPFAKVCINLVILLVLTMITDVLTLGHWASLGVLLGKE